MRYSKRPSARQSYEPGYEWSRTAATTVTARAVRRKAILMWHLRVTRFGIHP